ncbi:hypothetical protein DIE14_35040 [Burkholderia sp. Bp9017]|uniref:Uncharacterized protein n=1 Tax=Burkholderia anthina TaxID=179879 RepID=A0A7T6VET7_9BURK|nr:MULTISPECIES: hypothetical protein [Burkholderia]MBY4870702.1 hypothetical protein [Burkholderia anthina]QQK02620.1 hypothetical protein JFN94_00075 [Burkholderia anthina]RQZ13565.1 hypothetical protein DIE14_35040 [Burkholderia sp. Bp9017]RQZ26227.1 hypothetical protein DIE13_30980 [Burkholderia sp. Bp9016]
MTLAIRVDWESGAICADRTRIEVGNDGRLSEDVLRLCSPVQISKNGTTRYRVSQQIAFGGHTGECLVDMAQGRLTSVAILFDPVRFLVASITESKIVRSIAKSSGLTAVSGHPTEVRLEPCSWGAAVFRYDPVQGTLSFEVRFRDD